MSSLIKDAITIYYTGAIVRKWYIRKCFERELFLEMHFQRVINQEKQNKTPLTYYPVSWDVRKILEDLDLILASDDGHKKLFTEIPMIGFKNNKNLKAHLVRSQLPDLNELGRVRLSPSKNYFICFNDSPSKMMKNVFYFNLKALFILKIFKFLS